MKKIMLFIIAILLLPINIFAFDISSRYVYFYNIDREDVIYEFNANAEISIASMTKIMTAIVAIENIDDLNEKVTLTSKDFKGLKEANASTAGFKKGEKVTYRDLLYGLMLPSGADAALALSNNIAGSEDLFVELMNEKAKELQLENTHFANTTGLDEEGHYSSAYDVFVILNYALKNESFNEIFTTKKYTTSNKRLTFESTLYTSSKKYKLDTDYILGSKSGYTYDAGLCLASIAEFDGDLYLLVTAGADYKSKKPYHIQDSDKIYKHYFENYSYQTVINKGDEILTLTKENGDEVKIYADKNVELYLKNDSKITYDYNGKDTLTSGMKKGEYVGDYIVYADGEIVHFERVYLPEDIHIYDGFIFIIGIAIGFILIKLLLKKKLKF